MQPVCSGLHCQFLNHVLKALFFNQNSPKIRLFLQKNAKFSNVGGFVPKPHHKFLATRQAKVSDFEFSFFKVNEFEFKI